MTPEQQEKERMIIMQAMKTVGEMIPNTGFIVLSVKPDLAGGKDAYTMQLVTSLRPEFSVKLLHQAWQSAKRNFDTLKKQMVTSDDTED